MDENTWSTLFSAISLPLVIPISIIIVDDDDVDDNHDKEEEEEEEEDRRGKRKEEKKKERKTCYHLYTGYTKATNDMESVISIDNRFRKAANVALWRTPFFSKDIMG